MGNVSLASQEAEVRMLAMSPMDSCDTFFLHVGLIAAPLLELSQADYPLFTRETKSWKYL